MSPAAAPAPGHREPDATAVVLATVRALVAELHRGRAPVDVRPDSALDRDLGLDSLAVVELRDRLERACGVLLPDRALRDATTPAAWAVAVQAAAGARGLAEPAAAAAWPPVAGPAAGPPADAATLCEVLERHAALRPDAVQVRLLDHSARETRHSDLTYAGLHRRASAVADGLLRAGVDPGQSVGIMLPTGLDYFATFFGVLAAGAVPVPVYPPFRPAGLGDHLLRQAGILDNAEAVALLTVPEARPLARLLRARVPSLRTVATPADVVGAPVRAAVSPRPGDVALLQYTSGSTGDPKGVVLTHRQMLANIRSMGAAVDAGPEDVFVSWLPLYHDMGLIGAWLGSLYFGFPLVVMSPLDFIARPVRWLRAVQQHRATLTAGPNFAFELCLRRIPDDELAGLDLGSLRLLFDGAEPVSPDTVRRFTARFARHGLRPEALTPVYGLAEAAVGLAFSPPGRGPVVDVIDRRAFQRGGVARPAAPSSPDPLRFVACGRPLPGYQLRVVDRSGRELPDRHEGRLEFSGPSATEGYHRAPAATARLRRGDWLDTGDVGYVADGDVYVTGRVKDLVIRAGRNLHPAELEEAVGRLPGVRTGCVAVFAGPEPRTGTERLVVLAETREQDPQRRAEIRRRVVATAVDLLGTPPDDVALAPPGSVLKTSSGKIRRAATRARYEAGLPATRAGPVCWQLARFAVAGVGPLLRRWWRGAAAWAFAGYAWSVFVVLAVPTWLLVAAVPSRRWCWRLLRSSGRALRVSTATPLTVRGDPAAVARGPCVVVANHGSYLDGLALLLALPGPARFVAAADFAPRWLEGTVLSRLGSEYVAGRGPRDGAEDARRIAAAVRSGDTAVFFPEGGLHRAPGLRTFRMGAFAVAVAAAAPVVPVGISGARDVLRPGRRFPRHGRVVVTIGDPLPPGGSGWSAAVSLRDAARRAVLTSAGEHDAT